MNSTPTNHLLDALASTHRAITAATSEVLANVDVDRAISAASTALTSAKDNRDVVAAAALGSAVAGLAFWATRTVPLIRVPLEPGEARDDVVGEVKKVDPKMPLTYPDRPGKVQQWDPATCEWLGEVEDMTAQRVHEVVLRAQRAQRSSGWADTPFSKRRRFLQIIQKYIIANADTICRVSMRDSGKVKLDAVLGELTPTLEKLRWVINYGEDALKTERRGHQGMLVAHKSAKIVYKPVGVIAVFAPSNYPFTNLANHIISGLFAGNAVVIKVSEFTSWSADYYVRIFRTALAEVGADTDLIQLVTGLGPTGAALSSNPLVNKIIFTGSDKVGKIIAAQAAPNLTPCVLELGGKDPFIVCEDVDADRVARIAARGVFQNAGQNCIGIERIFVADKVAKPFIEKLTAIAKTIRLGVPLKDKTAHMGPVCHHNQLKHIQALVDDARSKGAVVHCGGRVEESLLPGLFFQATVISNVSGDMRITQEEVFGPVAVIRTYSTEQQLLDMVNDCPFALGSSIMTRDGRRAKRISDRLDAGMVNQNDFGVNYLVQDLPFGGNKASGYGCFGGPEGLRQCCAAVSMTEDRFPLIETDLPKPFTYPTAVDAPETAKALMKMAYGDGLTERMGGLVRLLTGLLFPQRR